MKTNGRDARCQQIVGGEYAQYARHLSCRYGVDVVKTRPRMHRTEDDRMCHPGQMKGANKAPLTPQEMIIFNAWQRFASAWNGRVWLRAHRDR